MYHIYMYKYIYRREHVQSLGGYGFVEHKGEVITFLSKVNGYLQPLKPNQAAEMREAMSRFVVLL